MAKKKTTWLEDILEESVYEPSSIYGPMGWTAQKFNWYKNQSVGKFPLDLLPSLQYYSGLSQRRFWNLICEHFPVVTAEDTDS